jgi:Periplasmic copper-binding protein (NosD)
MRTFVVSRAVLAAALAVAAALASMPALAVDCGDVITAPARLDRDLLCTTQPGLTVTGAALDLGGFTVSCDGTDVGILLDGSGARLRNGAVTGCVLAIQVAGDGGHRVRNVTASASNQGVLIESDGNFFDLNRVLRGLDDAAVQVNGSDNRLRFNAVSGSSDQGFEINGAGNRVIGNWIGGVAEGVQLQGDSNRVQANEIIGTTDSGVEVREGAHVIVSNRIADGAADGIVLRSGGSRIARNAILGNADQGLFVFVDSLGNTLLRNRVLLNRVDLTDSNPACDDNLWQDNEFETSESDDCVD